MLSTDLSWNEGQKLLCECKGMEQYYPIAMRLFDLAARFKGAENVLQALRGCAGPGGIPGDTPPGGDIPVPGDDDFPIPPGGDPPGGTPPGGAPPGGGPPAPAHPLKQACAQLHAYMGQLSQELDIMDPAQKEAYLYLASVSNAVATDCANESYNMPETCGLLKGAASSANPYIQAAVPLASAMITTLSQGKTSCG